MHFFQFVFIDHTGRPDIADALSKIRDALDEHVNGMPPGFSTGVCAEHGGACGFRVGTTDDRASAEIAINIRHTIPELPGALAYHFVTDGIPDIEVGADLFASLLDGPESMSEGIGHEVDETIADPGANLWADHQDGGGKTSARELCDRLQGQGLPASNGCMMPNFLLRSAFIPGAPGPWDARGLLLSQLGIAGRDGVSGSGYDIEGDEPAAVHNVDAEVETLPDGAAPEPPVARSHPRGLVQGEALSNGRAVRAVGSRLEGNTRARKAHPYSRTYRRGVRL